MVNLFKSSKKIRDSFEKKDTLCALPFMHFNVDPNGGASPCCASPHQFLDASGQPLNVRKHTLEEIWNSSALKSIRMQMLNGEEPYHCIDCYDAERAGFNSTRTNYNRMILKPEIGEDVDTDTFTGYSRISRDSLNVEMDRPTYFDLRFDNVCNLKCVMCFASESSSIEADPVQTAWTNEQQIERLPNRFGNSKKWVASDILFDELRDIGEHAEYIRLAGGEPFRSALALRWLAYLGETGKAENITIQVYTNLQLFNDRIINLLRPFRYVSIVLSIDGVGETYEYIRYPGKWNRLEQNCIRLAEERDSRESTMEVSINATMSVPGAMRILEVFEFGNKYGFGTNLSDAVHPAHVSTRYLPQSAKEQLERELHAYAEKYGLANMPPLINQWMTDMYSVDTRDPDQREMVAEVMRYINDLDATRGLDFHALQPELVSQYVEEYGQWVDETKFASLSESSVPRHLAGGFVSGDVYPDHLDIDGHKHEISEFTGGSIEEVAEHPAGFMLRGWAVDMNNGGPPSCIIVAIGDDVTTTGFVTKRRTDIEGGISSKAKPAGYEILVRRRGNRPTLDQPIKLFALSENGTVLPLAANFPADVPVAKVDFIDRHAVA